MCARPFFFSPFSFSPPLFLLFCFFLIVICVHSKNHNDHVMRSRENPLEIMNYSARIRTCLDPTFHRLNLELCWNLLTDQSKVRYFFLLYFRKLHFFFWNSTFERKNGMEFFLVRFISRTRCAFLSDSRCLSLNYIGGDNHLPCSTVARFARARRYRGVERRILSLVKMVDSEKQRSMLEYLLPCGSQWLQVAWRFRWKAARQGNNSFSQLRGYVRRNGRPARNLFSRSCRRASRALLRARRNWIGDAE